MKNNNKITMFNIASTIILQGLAFISGPIFSSVLGTRNYGIASTYLAWVQIASTVFTLQAAGTVALARVNFPLSDQLRYQSSVLSLASILYAIFSAVTIIAILFAKKWLNVNLYIVLAGLLQGWGMYCVGFMNGKFIYEFKAGKNFALSVITSVSTIGLSLILIGIFPGEDNYWGRIIGQSVVYTILGLTVYLYILKAGRTIYSKEYWKFSLPIGLPTVFHSLANIVLYQSDKIMIQTLINSSAAGIYSLSCTFGGVLNTVWHAFNNSWVPFYYEYTRTGQMKEMKRRVKNYIELFTIVTMGFILLAKEVFCIYADSLFWAGTDFIPLFSIGHYFVFLYSFCVNYEFYNKKSKTIAVGTSGAAICNVILNIGLIMIFGVEGAVIATVLAHGLQFIFHFFAAKKINPEEFPFKMQEFIPGLICVFATAGLYYITKELWLIRWGLGAVLGVYLLMKMLKRKEIF